MANKESETATIKKGIIRYFKAIGIASSFEGYVLADYVNEFAGRKAYVDTVLHAM